ncbi:dermonecrotic toxin domain-containing protein [Pseudomonas sp. CCOS 191]|uniref:dermonecrotic toxin domain-containing protein n=1 Tax=Pseudomonas sp. CCOS 191 TaxID=1649877 RepID=UPI0006248DDB|nr:DUF6543 domain-containing protein [Pseudomonas sp. CCOS 191]CRI54713.1 hypothetical protein CCOS191_0177 [Pseudomonas sp. CCOS 191]
MPLDLDHFARSLASLGDARALMDKAQAYLDGWPDPYRLAHEHAATYLLKHMGKPLDPDQVWWHVFDSAVGAATTTGWRHSGPPRQSTRFTELLIRRFGGGFQGAPDTLATYGGFYTQGPGAGQYGAENEVALLPKTVMDYLWTLDFADETREKTERFWGKEGLDFPVLARACFLAAIDHGVGVGLLEPVDKQNLRDWLGIATGTPLTLAALSHSGHGAQFAVCHFPVGNGHLVTLRHSSGRVVFYAPSLERSLRAFADHEAMVRWVVDRVQADDAQAWLDAVERADPGMPLGTRTARLSAVRDQSGSPGRALWPFGEGQALHLPDLFDTLMLWAKADLGLTLHNLVSNADLRKQLWRGYLGAFINVFGSFSLMAWPIGLVMLGAGGARLTLDIDTAVRASSQRERSQAILDSIADALVIIFAMIETGLGLRALKYREPPHFAGIAAAFLQPAREARRVRQLLDDLDSNLIVDDPIQTGGLLQGVSIDGQGRGWIRVGESVLPVHYSGTWSSWMVLKDLDDLEIRESLMVRRGLDGNWWLYAPEGDPGALTTQFWSTYMEPDKVLGQRLSLALLDRQARLLEGAGLPEYRGHMAPVDAYGHHYVEVSGKRFYTFRQEGALHNDLAMEYSSHMAKVNDLFRGDRTRLQGFASEMLDDFIDRLADSLELLPGSQASLLWRGGRGGRVALGARYREGAIKVGDLLVSTDFTSFTESPYIPRRFMLPKEVVDLPLAEVAGHFDEHTVLYELLGGQQLSGRPVAPLSLNWQEAEVLFKPGCTFLIDDISSVQGEQFRFLKFRLREVNHNPGSPVFDMRSGQPFERVAYAEQVGNAPWLERFFPAAEWS